MRSWWRWFGGGSIKPSEISLATIADLADEKRIQQIHLAEALG